MVSIGRALGKRAAFTDPTAFNKVAGRGLGWDQGLGLEPFCARVKSVVGPLAPESFPHWQRRTFPSSHDVLPAPNLVAWHFEKPHVQRPRLSLWNIPSEWLNPKTSWPTNKQPPFTSSELQTWSSSVPSPPNGSLCSVLRDDSMKPGWERKKSKWAFLGTGLCGHLPERACEIQWEPGKTSLKAVLSSHTEFCAKHTYCRYQMEEKEYFKDGTIMHGRGGNWTIELSCWGHRTK